MTNITLSIPDVIKQEMDKFPEINWSELAREEVLKRTKLAKGFEEFKKIVAK